MTATDSRTPVPVDRLKRLFNPRSIALIGASERSQWSRGIVINLEGQGFDGDIHLVNPRGGTILGRSAFASIEDLPGPVDLAFIMVPTSAVLETLEKLADAGVRSIVILTAGFSEVGDEGIRLEQKVVELARRRGVLILGPNGNGFVNTAARTAPYGMRINNPLIAGSIGVGLQSGALASSVLRLLETRLVGPSLLVAVGNEAMISITDVLNYFIDDDATTVIALFIESIRDPDAFREAAEEALRRGKPIVALKVGRSAAGAQAARAHTGSLVGDDRVFDAVLRQAGVLRVNSLEDLIVTASVLEALDELPGRRVAVVTPSGGACEIIADRAEDVGLELPPFSPDTAAALRDVLPDFASVHNPLDVTGFVLSDEHLATKAYEIVQNDPAFDAIILMVELPRTETPNRAATIAFHARQAETIRNSTKPTLALSNVLTDITESGRSVAVEAGHGLISGGIDHGITALGHAADWAQRRRELTDRKVIAAVADVPPVGVTRTQGILAEHEAAGLLDANGIPVVPNRRVESAEDAAAAADLFGYPVVLKLASDIIGHKSDIGGVRLDLPDADAVRAAFAEVVAAGVGAGDAYAAALVQPQRRGGTELIVGVVRDAEWGLVLAVGAGGVWVEVLDDSWIGVLPVSREQIAAGVRSLRIWPLLNGARGRQPADIDRLIDTIASIAQLAVRLGDKLEALEVNPLLVDGASIEALDALVTWAD
jgi:acyl-CoA synthetase (NDP forming)